MNDNTDTIICGLTEEQREKYQSLLERIEHERKNWNLKSYA